MTRFLISLLVAASILTGPAATAAELTECKLPIIKPHWCSP